MNINKELSKIASECEARSYVISEIVHLSLIYQYSQIQSVILLNIIIKDLKCEGS